jgi:hypothetical protein
MLEKMMSKTTGKITKMADKRSELVAYSRFLNNSKLKSQELIGQILIPPTLVENKDVLLIQDTTELNYQDHINYLDLTDNELGPTGNDKDMGFFIHPGMIVDTETGICMGYSYINIWNRRIDKLKKDERKYKSQPIEEKESYRWIECGQKSKIQLAQAKHITIVADRESDIYEEFVRVPDSKTDLIIRSKEDRYLYGEQERLYSFLSNQAVLGQITIKLKKDQRKWQSMRKATIDIVSTRVKIRRPKNHINKTLPEYVELYAIEARERNAPQGQQAVCWRFLTTYKAENLDVAVQVLHRYCMRWQIELLFATIKTSGLDIESSQLETGKALKVLCVLGLYTSLKINQLKQAREDKTGILAYLVFSKEEIIVLTAICKMYEGKTAKQKNHHQEGTLAWAAWIIGRIGGWKGYSSEAKPGIKTIRDGLGAFYRMYDGFQLAKMCA